MHCKVICRGSFWKYLFSRNSTEEPTYVNQGYLENPYSAEMKRNSNPYSAELKPHKESPYVGEMKPQKTYSGENPYSAELKL